MEYIRFPVIDAEVSRVAFGCAPMGLHQWGHTDEHEMRNAVSVALDYGLNFFETADIYGLGKSEEILGLALGNRRHEAFISTKFGVRRSEEGVTYYDNRSKYIGQALEASLARLRTDWIDHYQVHYWDSLTSLDDIFGTLEKFRSQGKIRSYGISNISLDEVYQKPKPDHLVSFSLKYSLAFRKDEDLIKKTISKHGLIFLSWGSLAEGLLSGKYAGSTKFPTNDRRRRKDYTSFHGTEFEKNLKIVSTMKTLVAHYSGVTLSQMAIRWILDLFPQSVALVGAKNYAQVSDNIAASAWRLRPEDIHQLDTASKTKTSYDLSKQVSTGE